MDKRRTFSREYKLAAVKKVIEQGLSYTAVAKDLGIGDSLIRKWKKSFDEDGTFQAEVVGSQSIEAELRRLREENRQLKMERDIPKKSDGILRQRKSLRLKFIGKCRDRWPIAVLCRTLEVTRAAYYRFAGRGPTATEIKQTQIIQAVKEIRLEKHHDAYGSPRMQRAIVKRGVVCCRNTVAKCMRHAGIQANRRTKFRISTTDSNHDQPIASNLLGQNFTTEAINRVWLTDITYIPTQEGSTYLCAFIDLHSRKIVSWKTSRNMDSELVVGAFDQALTFRKPNAGLIVHSDRGSQFASDHFRRRLAASGLVQSMSRRGNCYDNAPMESFFKSYKTEEAQQIYDTHEHATRGVSDYIERFHNPHRLHSSLGYLSPIDFEQAIKEPSLASES
ncbi:IS3-like element ISRba6 family transposase [Rhodopirellula baltica]|uniref:IS3-like element ISRba6 family transposase n=1 Tax=Rhodopirellula baltica TaxID=265606 RepID=UPI000A2F0638|nr:IS3-like element ISRba6 family transposase [Rhodopirellula baltica]